MIYKIWVFKFSLKDLFDLSSIDNFVEGLNLSKYSKIVIKFFINLSYFYANTLHSFFFNTDANGDVGP